MCGITAVVTLAGRQEAQAPEDHDVRSSANIYANGHSPKETLSSQLMQSLESIQHRGPDSNGEWISTNGLVGLSLQHLLLDPSFHVLEDPHQLTMSRPWQYAPPDQRSDTDWRSAIP